MMFWIIDELYKNKNITLKWSDAYRGIFLSILNVLKSISMLYIYVIAIKKNIICNDICLFVKIFYKNKQKYCPKYSTVKRTIITTKCDTISLFFLSLSQE